MRSRSAGALLALLTLLAALLGACARGSAATDGSILRIAAAADLRFTLPELLRAYRAAHPGVRVTVSYGSSGTLAAQLENRAPFDVYLSADLAYARRLETAGLVAPDGLFAYARGRIVVWVRQDSPLEVERLGLRVLLDPAVRKIAIANPEHAPYGRAAVAALQRAGMMERVKDRLVLGENIAQTAEYVSSGAADVGIIALSLALAPGADGRYVTIPSELHPPIVQGGAILRWASDPAAARAFVDLLLGPGGREVLARYGFEVP